VLVTDGDFAPAEDEALAAATRLRDAGIRLDVIAVGAPTDAARTRLADLASKGGGRVHTADAAGLAGTVPALRLATDAPTTGPARARESWLAVLGAVPAALRDDSPHPARVLARRLTPDGIALADAGAHPLLAARAHGAGRVLAWTSDLHGAWIDPMIAEAAIAAAAAPRASTTSLIVTAAAAPRTIEIVATTDAAAIASVDDRSGTRTVALAPSGVGRWSATTTVEPGVVAVAVAGVRAELALADPEHAGLGVDRALAMSPAHPRASSRTSSVIPIVAALAIALLLATLIPHVASPRSQIDFAR
jgi:hypothetical protein